MRHVQKYQQKILYHLKKVNDVRVSAEFKVLQSWQSQRLLDTHMALYRQPRFKPAMDFFKDELYCAEHFHRRNRQLMNAVPLMCRTMPEPLLEIVLQAADLHSLSLELDALLLTQMPKDITAPTMTMAAWQTAYKACNNPLERTRQIDLIQSLGEELARAVKKPMIHSLLNWAAMPAKLAGYGDIHHFVRSGFIAFEQLENADDFLIPVISTERTLSAQWFSDETVPPLRSTKP